MAEQLVANGRYKIQFSHQGTLAALDGRQPVLLPPSDDAGDAARWEVIFDGVDSYTLRNVAAGTYLGSDLPPTGPAPMLAMSKPFAWQIKSQSGPEGMIFTLSPRGSNGAMLLSVSPLRIIPATVGWLPAGSTPEQHWKLTFLEAAPTGFPSGDFRIINEDTGQALYTELGSQTTMSYSRLGNETTYVVSDKPKVGVRSPAGGAVEAWYFNTGNDSGERQPYLQLVSVAVARTNLGNHCLSRNYNPIYPEQSTVYLYGCGTSRNSSNDWRWQTEHGYIWGADSKHSPQDKSYLTLTDGKLTLQPKGKAGQRWRFDAPK
jgi:hypothetical protein